MPVRMMRLGPMAGQKEPRSRRLLLISCQKGRQCSEVQNRQFSKFAYAYFLDDREKNPFRVSSKDPFSRCRNAHFAHAPFNLDERIQPSEFASNFCIHAARNSMYRIFQCMSSTSASLIRLRNGL